MKPVSVSAPGSPDRVDSVTRLVSLFDVKDRPVSVRSDPGTAAEEDVETKNLEDPNETQETQETQEEAQERLASVFTSFFICHIFVDQQPSSLKQEIPGEGGVHGNHRRREVQGGEDSGGHHLHTR